MANSLAFFHHRRLLAYPPPTPSIYPANTAASSSPHSPVQPRWSPTPSARSSLPMLLPIFILFLLLLCFLSIFLLRDLLHFTSLWLNRRRLHAAAGNPQASDGTPPKIGLDPEILASFPTMPFEAARGAQEGRRAADCAVCLMEFAAGDAVRLLTVCRHAFHPACIDSWLGAHTTCPVCRSDLQAPPDEAAVIAIREAVDGGGGGGNGSEGRENVSHLAIAIEEECGTEGRNRKSHSSSCDRDGLAEEDRDGTRINR